MARLLLIPGSQRRASHNARLLHEAARRLHGRCTVDLLEPAHVRLPLFDQDLEDDPAHIEHAGALSRRMAAADGLIVAGPEYNGLPTPYLKNIVDWITRLPCVDGRFGNPFHGRPLLMCSASTGRTGGNVALAHHRALFGYVGATVLGAAVCVPCAGDIVSMRDAAWQTAHGDRLDGALTQLLLLSQAFAVSRQVQAQ
jgi:NAD(P)H-dependent FMN reductase